MTTNKGNKGAGDPLGKNNKKKFKPCFATPYKKKT